MGLFLMSSRMQEIFIPPHTDYVTQHMECPSECTSKFPPLHLVTYAPHMHQIGQKIWLQHIRDGVELPEIHRDDHYDFLRQQTYSVNVTLMPGDRLIGHCVWNSMDRNTNTTGGESSSQEMCVIGIQYYPAVALKSCSDGGTGTVASCSGRVNMTAYTYTALPPPQSTCATEEVGSGAVTLLSSLGLMLSLLAALVC